MDFSRLLQRIESNRRFDSALSDSHPKELPVLVMDGGMGTTLEDVFCKDLSSRLWSAALVQDDPKTLVQTHLAFLRSGCDLYSTATYQCAFETFEASGWRSDEAVNIMLRAVALADEAREHLINDPQEAATNSLAGTQKPRPLLALSLGSFGSILSPPQEFDGLYPLPFGPKAYTPFTSDDPQDHSTTAFASADGEERAIAALAQFHLRRLLVFAEHEETWSKIDCIAFETVPLLREGIAIRQAVQLLESSMRARIGEHWKMKPWWVSFAYAQGHCVQEESPGGNHITIERIVQDMFSAAPISAATDIPVPHPFALGINCTHPMHLPGLISKMSEALARLRPPVSTQQPWLIVYPNGGEVYDNHTRAWTMSNSDENAAVKWAEDLWKVVTENAMTRASDSCAWGGVIIGGCCKTAPTHIGCLRKAVDRL